LADERVFFRDVKPYDAPSSLDDLRGPDGRVVVLSHDVLWAPGGGEVGLDEPGGTALAYQAVLAEGTTRSADRAKSDESGVAPRAPGADSTTAPSASSPTLEERPVSGNHTPLDDPPLLAHADDWSGDELTDFQERLDAAVTDGPAPDELTALLDEVPDTPRNVASVLEHLVDTHARRVREAGRTADVVDAPVPDGAVARVGHILVVRWLTGEHAMGRRVIRRVTHSPAPAVAPPGRTGRLVVRHLAAELASPA